jgi:hypothetical protein
MISYIKVSGFHIDVAMFLYSRGCLRHKRHNAGITPSTARMPRHVPSLPYHPIPRISSPNPHTRSSTVSILPIPNIAYQPIHTLLHTPPIHRTTRHNTPIPVFQLAQPQRLTDLTCALSTRLILFVREDEEGGVAEFFFVEHGAEFFGGGGQALDVCAVDDKYYGGCVGVVAPPVGTDRGLAAEILEV